MTANAHASLFWDRYYNRDDDGDDEPADVPDSRLARDLRKARETADHEWTP